MFVNNHKTQKSLQQMLNEVNNNPSLCIELSDAEIVEIVGGAYTQAVIVEPSKTLKGQVCTCECNQSQCIVLSKA